MYSITIETETKSEPWIGKKVKVVKIRTIYTYLRMFKQYFGNMNSNPISKLLKLTTFISTVHSTL